MDFSAEIALKITPFAKISAFFKKKGVNFSAISALKFTPLVKNAFLEKKGVKFGTKLAPKFTLYS